MQPDISMYSRIPYDLMSIENDENKMNDLYRQCKNLNEKEKKIFNIDSTD